MKISLAMVQGFSGKPYSLKVPAVGEEIYFARDTKHGDWKASGYKTIPKGTKCIVTGWMQNFYGFHIRVKSPIDNNVHDIEIHEIDSDLKMEIENATE